MGLGGGTKGRKCHQEGKKEGNTKKSMNTKLQGEGCPSLSGWTIKKKTSFLCLLYEPSDFSRKEEKNM